MNSINLAIITGTIDHDPELKYSKSGLAILPLMINVVFERQDGTSTPNIVPVVMFGDKAESVSQIAHKGSSTTCQGHINARVFEKKDGTSSTSIQFICDSIQIMKNTETVSDIPF